MTKLLCAAGGLHVYLRTCVMCAAAAALLTPCCCCCCLCVSRAVILLESNLGMTELEELITRLGDRSKVGVGVVARATYITAAAWCPASGVCSTSVTCAVHALPVLLLLLLSSPR